MAQKKKLDLRLFRKISKAYELKFTKDGGNLNVSTWTAYFTVKSQLKDADNDAVLKKDVTVHPDGTKGIILISLDEDDTDLEPGNYYYDIKVKDADGNKFLIAIGKINVIETVTQRD